MGKCYTYQSILTADDINLCLTDTGAKRGEIVTLRGGEDHTYQSEECVCAHSPCVPCWVWGPLWSGSRGLLKMEGRGVLQDLIPGVGQLVISHIPVEGRVIDSYEHGLLDCPENPM